MKFHAYGANNSALMNGVILVRKPPHVQVSACDLLHPTDEGRRRNGRKSLDIIARVRRSRSSR